MRRAPAPSTVSCPVCGTGGPLPIVYGMPVGELFEKAERGEVVLGGCLITESIPEWHCRNEECRAEF